jgi:hypothetical protein
MLSCTLIQHIRQYVITYLRNDEAGKHSMHTLRIAAGSALALALSGLSVGCCYLFGTHLASGVEGTIYGVLGGVADALKAVLPLGIAAALASRQRGRAVIGLILFTVFSIYSFASELGLYALSRDAQASTATAGKEQFRQWKDEQGRIRERLKALGENRPSRAVNAEISGQLQNRLWGASGECKDASTTASRTFCAGIERLKAEFALAEESEVLRRRDSELGAKLAGLNLAEALKSADPQSEALARMTGFAPSSIKDALAILVALLIELGSGLGLYAATAGHSVTGHAGSNRDNPGNAPWQGEKRSIASGNAPSIRLERRKPADPVRQFAKATLRPAPGKTIAAADLYSAFAKWANAEGCEVLSPLALGRRLTALKYERVKRGGFAHYAGVEIVA